MLLLPYSIIGRLHKVTLAGQMLAVLELHSTYIVYSLDIKKDRFACVSVIFGSGLDRSTYILVPDL